MKNWNGGVTGLYFILFAVSFLAWLSLGVDTLRMLPAYIYPYPYVVRGFGDVSPVPIIVFQIIVVISYCLSLLPGKAKYKYINIFAGVSAILWFIMVSIIMLVSILN